MKGYFSKNMEVNIEPLLLFHVHILPEELYHGKCSVMFYSGQVCLSEKQNNLQNLVHYILFDLRFLLYKYVINN